MAEATRHSDPSNPAVHHETKDVNVRAILIFLATFVVAAIIIHVLLWVMYIVLERQAVKRDEPPVSLVAPDTPRVPPEPRLQVLGRNPVMEMRILREREARIMTTYGLADPKTGAVRIPIDQAMRIALQRGFPVRAGRGPVPQQPGDAGAPHGAIDSPAVSPDAGTGLPMQSLPVDEREQFERVPTTPRRDAIPGEANQ